MVRRRRRVSARQRYDDRRNHARPACLSPVQAAVGLWRGAEARLQRASSFGFDFNQGFLQYSTAQATYNWDCCGFSVEYRRFALGLVRNENQFRFAFTLANVGAFGNLKRQERLY